ncbi:energy transducer TonB [Flavobacterium reichenbachii]|uniref:hypothetical protein n=1 Tax=Flavobacterium reichenbachii TaxID=362418 RepID=UPI00068C77EC|nr:hypothetical protein [Flavobacterium reichenbachii]OXB18452.1 hypothetical protein B0A68_00050 [Flavobacterium reichenbachii]
MTKPLHKITVPEPCHENWDKMTPKDNGRFCMSCSKTVVDFTSMLPDEIQHFFIQNQTERICGRFRKSQLDNVTIQIPSRVLYAQTQYHKMFLLALFIAMGTTLFSCADKDGNKTKIDKVELVEDSTMIRTKTIGILLPPKHDPKDSLNQINAPAAKVEQIKLQKTAKKNSKAITVTSSTIICALIVPDHPTTIIADENNTIQEVAEEDVIVMGASIETSPNYPGGINNFYQFFMNEFKLPEEAENPKKPIIAFFVIEKDGSLSSFDIPKNADPRIGAEIIRVLKKSPKWIPGEQNGKRTRTKYSFPITFE